MIKITFEKYPQRVEFSPYSGFSDAAGLSRKLKSLLIKV